MTDQAKVAKHSGRFVRFRRDPWRAVYNVVGGEWCGNTTAPCDHLTLRVPMEGATDKRDVHVYNVNEDGGTFWIGYPDEWKFHMGRSEARRVALWILFRWWAWGEWFGLRRWLWVKALHKVCERNRRSLPSQANDSDSVS